AAAGLFGTTPAGLDAAQSAILAALVAAPSAAPAVVARRARALRGTLTAPPPRDAIAAASRVLAGRPTLPPVRSLAPHVARHLLVGSPVVRTTLDADLQRTALAALHRNLVAVRDRGMQDGALL